MLLIRVGQAAARFAAKGGTDKVRRFTDFYDGAASWSRIRVHLPTACPVQTVLRLLLTRIPRLAT